MLLNSQTGDRQIAETCILVVDDDRDIRELLADFVEGEFGLSASQAADGAQALDFVHRTAPNLVITDVRMPIMDGVELVRRLRNEPQTHDLPIIVVAASVEARREAMNAGADDYVDKPFNAALLASTVRRYLRRIPSVS